jgi:hypothetical protein
MLSQEGIFFSGFMGKIAFSFKCIGNYFQEYDNLADTAVNKWLVM